jgi:hypothetical protein
MRMTMARTVDDLPFDGNDRHLRAGDRELPFVSSRHREERQEEAADQKREEAAAERADEKHAGPRFLARCERL